MQKGETLAQAARAVAPGKRIDAAGGEGAGERAGYLVRFHVAQRIVAQYDGPQPPTPPRDDGLGGVIPRHYPLFDELTREVLLEIRSRQRRGEVDAALRHPVIDGGDGDKVLAA